MDLFLEEGIELADFVRRNFSRRPRVGFEPLKEMFPCAATNDVPREIAVPVIKGPK